MHELYLKKRLFDIFGGFADKRIKNLTRSDLFICDARKKAPTDARGILFRWYCTITLRVVSGEMIHIILGSAMPINSAVSNWTNKNSIKSDGSTVIPITKKTISKLGELATLIEFITIKPYDVRAYKYECPRVASILRRVEKILQKIFAG
jgi:hypothetical protein